MASSKISKPILPNMLILQLTLNKIINLFSIESYQAFWFIELEFPESNLELVIIKCPFYVHFLIYFRTCIKSSVKCCLNFVSVLSIKNLSSKAYDNICRMR